MKVGQSDGTVKDEMVLTGSNVKVDGATSPIIPSMEYNGATYDLRRNNTQGTLLASAARTATAVGSNQTNYNAKGISVFLNITVASGTGGINVSIDGVDPVTGNNFQLNPTPTPIITTGKFSFELGPSISVAGGSVVQRTNGLLPRIFRVNVNHTDGSSYTYSLGYSLNL